MLRTTEILIQSSSRSQWKLDYLVHVMSEYHAHLTTLLAYLLTNKYPSEESLENSRDVLAITYFSIQSMTNDRVDC